MSTQNVSQSAAAGLPKSSPIILSSFRAAALVAFAVCVTVCACVVVLLDVRTRPIYGDFCRASFGRSNASGIITFTGWEYTHWTGRWAGVWLESLLLSKTPQPAAYPWLVLLLIAGQGALLYVAVRYLIADSRWALYFTALIATVYWAVMPNLQQGTHWVLGIVESQLPLTTISLLFVLVISQRLTATGQPTLPVKIAVAVLGFLTPAFHELAGIMLVLALSLITATAFASKSPLRKTWLIAWTATTIGFLIVFVAPGNAVRMATIPNRGNHAIVIHEVLSAIKQYILPWCLDFRHWLLAVLLWVDPRIAALRTRLPGLSSFWAISIFLLCWISLVVGAVGPAVWNLGTAPPGRTMNMIYGMFLMGWIALAFLVIRPHPNPSVSIQPAQSAVVFPGALLLLCALVGTSHNTRWSISDFRHGRAQAWGEEMDQRYAVLKSGGRDANIIVPPISEFSKGSTLAGVDIYGDPNRGVNRCTAKYFGVASVRVSSSTE
jgi:Family of unknown function (DUF6056)